MSHAYLFDQNFLEFVLAADRDLANETRAEGCRHCGGKLHSACYWRFPLGGVVERAVRYSFCCELCRRRQASRSVLFLGQRHYVAAIVVLAAAIQLGLSARRVEQVRSTFGVSERTLRRWRQWWLRDFAVSRFFRSALGRLPIGLDRSRLPASLLEAFGGIEVGERLRRTLTLLAPIASSQRLLALAR